MRYVDIIWDLHFLEVKIICYDSSKQKWKKAMEVAAKIKTLKREVNEERDLYFSGKYTCILIIMHYT
jgi:hypothetical protein